MKVNSVKFNYFPKEANSITKALGQVKIFGCITINFSLKHAQHGYFISLGNDRKGKDGKYYACVRADKEFYQELTEAIVKAYDQAINGQANVQAETQQEVSVA